MLFKSYATAMNIRAGFGLMRLPPGARMVPLMSMFSLFALVLMLGTWIASSQRTSVATVLQADSSNYHSRALADSLNTQGNTYSFLPGTQRITRLSATQSNLLDSAVHKLAGRWTADVLAAAKKTDVPAVVIAAVLQTESNGRPWVKSPAGARGLMQVLPATARHMGIRDWWVPERNILAGALYLKWLLVVFDGNLSKVLAAYNAGPTVVARYNGIPPYRETQDYVRKVQSLIVDTENT